MEGERHVCLSIGPWKTKGEGIDAKRRRGQTEKEQKNEIFNDAQTSKRHKKPNEIGL